MIPTICICFAGLLLLGVPIAVILGVSTLVSLVFFSSTPLHIITQQLFNALDKFVLLAIPFFILAGAIMTRGGIDLVHFGIVMVLNIQMGMLTPPFGLNLFVASGITRQPLVKNCHGGFALSFHHAGLPDVGDLYPLDLSGTARMDLQLRSPL